MIDADLCDAIDDARTPHPAGTLILEIWTAGSSPESQVSRYSN